jgi:hypothetical protein
MHAVKTASKQIFLNTMISSYQLQQKSQQFRFALTANNALGGEGPETPSQTGFTGNRYTAKVGKASRVLRKKSYQGLGGLGEFRKLDDRRFQVQKFGNFRLDEPAVRSL